MEYYEEGLNIAKDVGNKANEGFALATLAGLIMLLVIINKL